MNRKKRIQTNEISEVITCSLKGYQQKVLIEGKYKTNPIVLFLHGGPGFPLPFCVGSRGMHPEYTDAFIMVYWDQYGCGINNYKLDESFKLNDYVEMTIDLINEIKQRFPNNELNLFGTSWGSVLAAKAASTVPNQIHKVITYGQGLHQLTFNEVTIDALNHSQMSNKNKQYLKSIMEDKEVDTILKVKQIMKWLQKYTEGYVAKDTKKLPMMKYFVGFIRSPDYRFKDVKALILNETIKNESLLIDFIHMDITEELKHIQVPYKIIQGSKDLVTPTTIIKNFTTKVLNKNLSIEVIENSSHIPSVQGMNQLLKFVKSFLLSS